MCYLTLFKLGHTECEKLLATYSSSHSLRSRGKSGRNSCRNPTGLVNLRFCFHELNLGQIVQLFSCAVLEEIYSHSVCFVWLYGSRYLFKKSRQQWLTIIQIYVFYWIIFQNKTSPLISCRSYCRNVHQPEGGHGERANGGLVCVDTWRELTLMSQTTGAYTCSRKNKIQIIKSSCQSGRWAANSAGCLLLLEPAGPDC